jgi:heat shock protein HtpX
MPKKGEMRLFFNWRWLAFALYLSVYFVLPLSILGNEWGIAIGASLAVALLISLRWQGTEQLWNRLKLTHLPERERPEIPHMVREYCRRLAIPVPKIGILDSNAYNLAVFGFSRNDAVIVLTKGVLSLPREQLSALLARATSALWHRDFRVETWLARYLSLFIRHQERSVPRRFYSTRVFLKQMLLYPLTVVPSFLLRGSLDPETLDLKAAKLCQNPRQLAEALRVLEAARERVPLRVPYAVSRLFLITPPFPEALLELFWRLSGCVGIRVLESFSQLVNPV